MTPHAPQGAIHPPDIGAYRSGNTGIDYLTCLEAGRPGPHVMISAVVHGNELCGAIALDWLFRQGVRPLRGRLTLGFMNVDAYLAFDPANPTASRYVAEDFNRLWSPAVLDGPRQSPELARARALRPWIDTVDLLLDLHSMQRPGAPLVLCGLPGKGRRLGARMGAPAILVADAGHAAGTRLRDYGAFADPDSDRVALLVECGQHWQPDSATVAIDTAIRFLRATGCVAADFGRDFLRARPAPPPQRFIEVTHAVTVETGPFRFLDDFRGMETIPKAGTPIARDGDRLILTPYDDCVLVMPSDRLARGNSAVRLGRERAMD